MKLPLTDRDRQEIERYALRFCCEDCSYFHVPSARCAHGWPNHEHRREHYRGTAPAIVFCKEFELL